MYHPGKVLAVHGCKDKNIIGDDSTQATLEMWDDNVITFMVIPEIANKIKKGDVALVDYRPISEKVPFPKHTIIKVLKANKGKEIWNEYTSYLKKKKGSLPENSKKDKLKAIKQPATHTYAG